MAVDDQEIEPIVTSTHPNEEHEQSEYKSKFIAVEVLEVESNLLQLTDQ